MSSPSFGFTAIAGITVVLMFPLVPGHGTCPQGVHNKFAAHDIVDVSVLFFAGFSFLSVLLKPLRTGVPW